MKNKPLIKKKGFRISSKRYRKAIDHRLLVCYSPNDRCWHLYSDFLDLYIYEDFPTKEEAMQYVLTPKTKWSKDDI